MIKANSLSIDTAAVMAELKSYYMDAMREAEDKFVEILEQEVIKPKDGNGPGKPAWRQSVSEQMAVIEERFVDNYLEADVGYDGRGMMTDFIKAMLISEGAGSAAGNPPITAGPEGRSVWDDDLSGKHPSNAKSSYLMPAGWNQAGNHFVENAVKRMELFFDAILENASANLPDSIFYGNVFVSD